MILFKRIEVDLDAERKRIDCVYRGKPVYNKRQRKVLHTLVNLFEQGKFQKCLNHINDKKAFPRNPTKEYSEREHIGIEIGNVLRSIGYEVFYTEKQLLEELKDKL